MDDIKLVLITIDVLENLSHEIYKSTFSEELIFDGLIFI